MNTLLRIAILVMLLTHLGCSSATLKKSRPPDVMYEDAITLFNEKNYDAAVTAFQELNSEYPSSQHAVQAKLKIADAYFNDEKYPDAISAYREFEKLHPNNENVPYVVFQTGMSYFNQMSTIDRDQTAAVSVSAEFSRFLSRFPDSPYTDKAINNLAAARNSLAENELYIGEFYYRQGNLRAAATRFEGVLTKYPEFAAIDRVLFYAGKACIEVNEIDKGKEFLKRLVDRYPDSQFASDAKGIIDSK